MYYYNQLRDLKFRYMYYQRYAWY